MESFLEEAMSDLSLEEQATDCHKERSGVGDRIMCSLG